MDVAKIVGLDWRRAALYACLAGLLLFAIAGPLHLHDRSAKSDAGCTFCHAGQQTIASAPATDAGKPLQFTEPRLLVESKSERGLDARITVRTPRAPPLSSRFT